MVMLLSLISSLIFVGLTYQEVKYRILISRNFQMADAFIMGLHLIEFSIRLYIAPQRCHFFIQPWNLMLLFIVIMPPILWDNDNEEYWLMFFQAVSRFLRIINTKEFFKTVLGNCLDIDGNEVNS